MGHGATPETATAWAMPRLRIQPQRTYRTCPECGKGFAPRATRPYKVSSTASSLSIIVAWHLIFFPTTLVFVDWLLGYGASVNGVVVLPGSFDLDRALNYFLDPILMLIYVAVLSVEGGLAWILFRITRGRNFRLFMSSWKRICLWGALGLPVASVSFALISRSYNAGMNFPLLWVPIAVVLVTLTTKMPYAQGHCQQCGYDLRGSKERCPECGNEFEMT